MTTYTCWDESCHEVEIEADSAIEAAQEYVDDGDYGSDPTTTWVTMHVYVDDEDDVEMHSIAIDPQEPQCLCSDEDRPGVETEVHDWQSPIEVVGGCRESPGVHGHGGGVIIHEVCAHCGVYRMTDTWAQNGAVQGLESIAYRPADEASEEWISKCVACGETDCECDECGKRCDECECDGHCECSEECSERCHESAELTIELMPRYLRATHQAAGNMGRYPHNGAVRLQVSEDCATKILVREGDWAFLVGGET